MPLLIADPESAFLDTVPSLAHCFQCVLRRRGVRIAADVESMLRGGTLDQLQDELGTTLLKELLVDTSREFSEKGLARSLPYRGITACLRELSVQGYTLALVTRTGRSNVTRLLAQVSLGIDVAFVAAPRQTQPAAWRRNRLAQLAESGTFNRVGAVHISDDPFDVEAARNAGIRSYFAGYGRFPWQRVQSLGIGPVVHSPWQLTHRVLGAVSTAVH